MKASLSEGLPFPEAAFQGSPVPLVKATDGSAWAGAEDDPAALALWRDFLQQEADRRQPIAAQLRAASREAQATRS